MRFRTAVERDVADVRRIHQAAIREVCSRNYPPDVISAWLAGNSNERYVKRIRETTFWMVEADESIGFGNVCLASCKLGSLFLSPHVLGKGVAALLLQHLEGVASEAGVEILYLDSSLSAEAFYVKHGYGASGGNVSIELASGAKLAGIPMAKRLRVGMPA